MDMVDGCLPSEGGGILELRAVRGELPSYEH